MVQTSTPGIKQEGKYLQKNYVSTCTTKVISEQ